MSNNIINFSRSLNTVNSKPAAQVLPHHVPGASNGLNNKFPQIPPHSTSDGRRKKDAKSRSIEPNIQEMPGETGGHSYRVQIRKSASGQSFSFTRTFSKLSMARKWKKRKLAEIEFDGVEMVAKNGDTVADAITARLAVYKYLGRSARQQLNWLKASDFGKQKLSDLSLIALTDLANDMLNDERQPQTVAGYPTVIGHERFSELIEKAKEENGVTRKLVLC
ncbi:hypothetical protein [Phaeovulum sp.]|uniref:hypothetical protein n=1 Tax=Phaeovulum sp. TaxID=2934796 RepID=UPI0039E6A7FA